MPAQIEADKSSPIPSSFDLVQTLSKCILRNWPPSYNACGSQEQSKDAQRCQYDAAMAALEFMEEDLIYSLRKIARVILAARNSASPIFQLPIEVFRRVFAFLGGDIRDKLSVSQSCSVWRAIITEDPFLWTNIDMDTIQTPEIASKAFRNAKTYPLQLRCRQWNDLRLHCVTLEMDRIEELETVFTVPTFRNLCRTPAPLLKRFSIAVPAYGSVQYPLMYMPTGGHNYADSCASRRHPNNI
ncbi:hypothetical protein BC629DRAFT_1438091 [Irpex lacteus]|nr:hypothetical protein BC629DRAFT_1438091 [Irpex lacteus]